jgi:hypothetical protein
VSCGVRDEMAQVEVLEAAAAQVLLGQALVQWRAMLPYFDWDHLG